MAVDEDTKKCLEEVKQGKPRRFVLICKGINIVSMVVFKKGAVEKYKKQAKEQGKGQVYHGVIDGKGVDIVFKLARSDGYDKEPGNPRLLKEYLLAEADMKFKPVYEIVEELPGDPDAAADTEPDLAMAPPVTPSTPTQPPDPAPQPPTGPADDDLARLMDRIKALKPDLERVITAQVAESQDAKLRASEAAVSVRKKDFRAANQLLDQVEELVRQGLQRIAAPSIESADPAAIFAVRLRTCEALGR